MEFSHIIVRYGELTLKSGNRNEFLKKINKKHSLQSSRINRFPCPNKKRQNVYSFRVIMKMFKKLWRD